MSHMTEIQRSQLDRLELGDAQSTRIFRPTTTGRKLLTAYLLIGLAILGVLTYAAIEVFDGWHHAIVLADLAVVFLGIAAWNNPRRKHA
jgi:hypothetical protein